MSLRTYKQKRHFDRTPEPAGKVAPAKGRSFVVQKHYASHRHYDFRLELDGVLKSWAVPKGPSLDPSVKRLAMHVEDHPVEYGSFEGIIPKGEYGGGTVMLWDRGDWEPLGNAKESYEAGKLKFKLHGEKLRGAWMLVRTGKPDASGERRQWLLFKERDDEARSADKGDILEEMPDSVSTGRTMEEIAAQSDRVWSSKQGSEGTSVAGRGSKSKQQTAALDYDVAKQTFHGVRLTSPTKVLYPEDSITKLELAHYYRAVAEWMLPYLADRPLVLVRCPEGRDKECFYQKHPVRGTPDTLRRVLIQEQNEKKPYVVVDDVDGLISLAQIGALEIHGWGSRTDKLEQPDRLIFDLDPDPSVAWSVVVAAARQVRQFLQELGLESFVKTTGGKGLHLVVPIRRQHDWEDVKAFCKSVADLIVRADTAHYTANMSKSARTGKIYIDYLRNGRGSTAILPFSPRARPDAPVSVPLRWDELSARIPSNHYTIRNVMSRLTSLRKDPWSELTSTRQGLAGPIKKVRTLDRG